MAQTPSYEHKYKVLSFLRIALGLFFLYVGIRKIFTLSSFVEDIARFDIVPIAYEEWVAYLGIACELAVGLCFLTKRLYLAAVSLGVAMCSVFVGIFLQGWIRGLELSCSCLGVQREVSNYPFEILWRVGLLLAVLALFWEIRKQQGTFFDKAPKLNIRPEY